MDFLLKIKSLGGFFYVIACLQAVNSTMILVRYRLRILHDLCVLDHLQTEIFGKMSWI